MDAGRELDALIALRVLGWSEQNLRHAQMMNGDYFDYDGDTGLPRYSTDIAAAWQVVDHLRSCGLEVRIGSAFGLFRWECVISRSVHHDAAEADSAPLAICLAALRSTERARREG